MRLLLVVLHREGLLARWLLLLLWMQVPVQQLRQLGQWVQWLQLQLRVQRYLLGLRGRRGRLRLQLPSYLLILQRNLLLRCQPPHCRLLWCLRQHLQRVRVRRRWLTLLHPSLRPWPPLLRLDLQRRWQPRVRVQLWL